MADDTNAEPARGRVFTYPLGRAVCLSAREDGKWTVLDLDRTAVEAMAMTGVTWLDQFDEQALTDALRAAVVTLTARTAQAQSRVRDRERVIEEIRQYAIDRHREGHFCREGLNEALEHFGLDWYQPRHTVAVTITATVQVNADDADQAESRVRYLIDGVAFSGETSDDDLDISTDDIEVHALDSTD